MSDAVYDVTTLVINAGDYGLRASGAILKFPGHLQLIGKSAEDEKEKSVPYLEAGTELLLHKLMPAEQHFTEPPAHFTEATLVKELEEKGIGRPSTYAPTIQTILDRGYVAKDAKKLVITELGLLTVDMLTKYFSGLINIPFSAEMENSLDEIAENHVDKNEIISKFYNPFIKDLEEAENAIGKVELPVEVSDVPCDKCGRMMVIKDGRFGKFLACPGFPECRNAKPILKKIGIKCPVCGKGDVIERKTKTRKIFYGCENYSKTGDGCSFLSWDKPTEKTCDKCGGMLLEHIDKARKKKLYCINQDCSNSKPVRKVSKKSDA